MYSERGDLKEAGFPHSEICGSAPICRRPAAYRRLSRPSSPIIAKASTTCTCSLDPITLLPQTTKQRGSKSPTPSQSHKLILTLVHPRFLRSEDTMQYITQCPHYSPRHHNKAFARTTTFYSRLLKSSRSMLRCCAIRGSTNQPRARD